MLIANYQRGGYPPIEDWSTAARAALVATHGDEIRLLLDEAFTIFGDEIGLPLGAFGFRSDDPVAEAANWCMERFALGDINPALLSTRTWRIFTEVRWWLAQRVGVAAYRRIVTEHAASRAPARQARAVDDVAANEGKVEGVSDLDAFEQRFARTLKALATRTCADLVGYWLEGTKKLRAKWFEWSETSAFSGPTTSPKQRSFRIADALFRFLALDAGLVLDDAADLDHHACVVAWFSGCPNEPPYRNPETRTALVLALPCAEVPARRRRGLRALVEACVALRTPHGSDAESRVLAEFARRSMRKVLPDVFSFDDDPTLKALFRFEEESE